VFVDGATLSEIHARALADGGRELSTAEEVAQVGGGAGGEGSSPADSVDAAEDPAPLPSPPAGPEAAPRKILPSPPKRSWLRAAREREIPRENLDRYRDAYYFMAAAAAEIATKAVAGELDVVPDDDHLLDHVAKMAAGIK